MTESARPARQQVLETAAALFFREGFRAVGIDTIVAQSGVAKMTLYRHFPSKDDLIAAYLTDSNEKFWEWFGAVTAPYAGDPHAQLVAFFGALETLVTTPQCYGCPFLNAIVDFPDTTHPGNQVAVQHKQAVRSRFRELAAEANARTPERLADHLLMLMDGAFMSIRMFGSDNPALHVSAAADMLIEAHLSD